MNTPSSTSNLSFILKASMKTTLKTSFLIILAMSILVIIGAIFREKTATLLLKIPLISGYIHATPIHFLENIMAIFLFLLPAVNRSYTSQDIYRITFLLSLLYLPLVFLQICPPAVGISGTCYFLFSRAIMAIKYRRLAIALLVAFFLMELYSSEPHDGVAHIVHFMGLFLGYLSIKKTHFLRFSLIPISGSITSRDRIKSNVWICSDTHA